MKKNNLIFLTNTMTKYQYDFFDRLYNYLNFRVIVLNKYKYENYNFNFPKKKYTIFLSNDSKNKERIKKIISNFKPKKIIFCGYRIKYSFFIRKIIDTKYTKIYYWLERINKESKSKLLIISILLKKILEKADGVFAIGNEAKSFYKKFNKNVINLPYSIKIIKKVKKKNINQIKFLFVGQLIKRKGVDILLKTLENLKLMKHQNFTVTIVGNGNYRDKIIKLSKIFPNLKYYKFMKSSKLYSIYKKSHVLIFPSIFDGWGVVPLEAMVNNMFVITSRNCGVNEIIKKKKNKILPIVNVKNINKSIKYCLQNINKVLIQGSNNYLLIKNSLCNLDISINVIKKELQ